MSNQNERLESNAITFPNKGTAHMPTLSGQRKDPDMSKRLTI